MSNYKRYYIDNHYVFITVVTYNRTPILIHNIDLLCESFRKTLLRYNYEIYAIVVLPDHFHMIIKPENIKEFSKIVGSIKKHFTYYYDGASKRHTLLSNSRLKRSESSIWQRRFYDHIIRNDEDMNKHINYIHYNPVKHGYVNAIKTWKYSSFHKFVKNNFYTINWGSFEEVENIKEMDLE